MSVLALEQDRATDRIKVTGDWGDLLGALQETVHALSRSQLS